MIVVTKSSKRYVYETDDIFEIKKILKEYIKDKRYSIPTIALQLKYGGVDIKCEGIRFQNMSRVIFDENTIKMGNYMLTKVNRHGMKNMKNGKI